MSHPQKSYRNTDSMGPDVLNIMKPSESGGKEVKDVSTTVHQV